MALLVAAAAVSVAQIALLLLVEVAEDANGWRSRLGERLDWHGSDIQRFVATAARTNAMNATANLAVLLLAGVEYPVLWCVLYFFLNFIPSIGYLIALVLWAFVLGLPGAILAIPLALALKKRVREQMAPASAQ